MPHTREALAAGRIRLGLLLGFTLLALGIYGGVQASYHYWAYWNLKEEAERAAIEVAAKEEAQGSARGMIIAKAREYDIVFTEKDIAIKSAPTSITVSFAWERNIELPYYSLPLTFQVNTSIRRTR